MVKNKKGFHPKPRISDRDIALYTLHLLGGWQKRIHTEDIALKCYQLAPSRFSWVKYPQYPDPSPARFALEDAKQPINGALVKGGSERRRTTRTAGGWMLTSNGIQWIHVNKDRIEKYLGQHIPTGDRVPADRKLNQLFRSMAFKKFMDHGDHAEISHAEFAESLVCTVNTRPEVINDRLEQFYSIGEELGKQEVKNYVDFCRNRFASFLGEGVVGRNATGWNSKRMVSSCGSALLPSEYGKSNERKNRARAGRTNYELR